MQTGAAEVECHEYAVQREVDRNLRNVKLNKTEKKQFSSFYCSALLHRISCAMFGHALTHTVSEILWILCFFSRFSDWCSSCASARLTLSLPMSEPTFSDLTNFQTKWTFFQQLSIECWFEKFRRDCETKLQKPRIVAKPRIKLTFFMSLNSNILSFFFYTITKL